MICTNFTSVFSKEGRTLETSTLDQDTNKYTAHPIQTSNIFTVHTKWHNTKPHQNSKQRNSTISFFHNCLKNSYYYKLSKVTTFLNSSQDTTNAKQNMNVTYNFKSVGHSVRFDFRSYYEPSDADTDYMTNAGNFTNIWRGTLYFNKAMFSLMRYAATILLQLHFCINVATRLNKSVRVAAICSMFQFKALKIKEKLGTVATNGCYGQLFYRCRQIVVVARCSVALGSS